MYTIIRKIAYGECTAEITLVSSKVDTIERVIDFESVIGLIRMELRYPPVSTANQLYRMVQGIIQSYERYHEGLEIGMRATKVRLLSNTSTEQRLLDNSVVSIHYLNGVEYDSAICDMVPSE